MFINKIIGLMAPYAAVVLGGGLGALLRVSLAQLTAPYAMGYPLNTLLVNTLGGFGAGVCYYMMQVQNQPTIFVQYFLLIGFLGGLTTFSSFSIDSMVLIRKGFVVQAGSFILLNVVLSLVMTVFAYKAMKWLLH